MCANEQTRIVKRSKIRLCLLHASPIGILHMNKRSAFPVLVITLIATMLATGCTKSPENIGSMASPSTAVGNVSDIDVTQHVKTALLQNESLKGFDIAVVTLKGDVRLTGQLENQAQIDQVIKIARASEGAHTIHDELTLKK